MLAIIAIAMWFPAQQHGVGQGANPAPPDLPAQVGPCEFGTLGKLPRATSNPVMRLGVVSWNREAAAG